MKFTKSRVRMGDVPVWRDPDGYLYIKCDDIEEFRRVQSKMIKPQIGSFSRKLLGWIPGYDGDADNNFSTIGRILGVIAIPVVIILVIMVL